MEEDNLDRQIMTCSVTFVSLAERAGIPSRISTSFNRSLYIVVGKLLLLLLELQHQSTPNELKHLNTELVFVDYTFNE